jgi:hypothetical protein
MFHAKASYALLAATALCAILQPLFMTNTAPHGERERQVVLRQVFHQVEQSLLG